MISKINVLIQALSNNSITDLDFRYADTIRVALLRLGEEHWKSSDIKKLAVAAANNTSLTSVGWRLEGSVEWLLEEDYSHHEASFLKALSNLGNLKQLNTINSESNDGGEYIDFSAVAQMVTPQLECLQIYGNKYQRDAIWNIKSFLGAISLHPSLHTIGMNILDVSDDILESGYLFFVLGSIPNLVSVNLSFDHPYGHIGNYWHYLFSAPNLRECCLAGFGFHGDDLAAAVAASQSLQRLDLDNCDELSGKTVNLARSLSTHPSMTACRLEYLGISSEFYNDFSKGLAENTVLDILRIRHIIPDDLPYLSSIPTALESNQVLTCLDLDAYNGDAPPLEFYEALSKALSVNKILESLVVDFPVARMPEGACAVLARGVASSYKLWSLEMRSPLDNDSPDLVALAEAARINKNLERVFVFQGSDGEEFGNREGKWAYLNALLQLNQAGRRYLAQENTIKSGVEVLAKVSDKLDCLYIHLLENPGVLCNLENDKSRKRKLQHTILL